MRLTFASARVRRMAAVAVVMGMLHIAAAGDLPAQEAAPASPMGQMFSAMNPMNWKMPDFKGVMPGNQEKARIREKKDGLFSEMGRTASNSWGKTKEVLNPQKLNPVNFFQASARTPSQSVEEEKPGFFRSLFFPEPLEEKTTVNDFLNQSRPTP